MPGLRITIDAVSGRTNPVLELSKKRRWTQKFDLSEPEPDGDAS